jgi:ribosomal protein S18 acetylase RimI-like enzyme
MHIRPFQSTDAVEVVALWERCGLTRPWNDPFKDIERKSLVQPDLFLVGIEDGAIVAAVMAGYDGHRGSIYYLGVAPEHQRSGFGRELMDAAEERLRDLGCPKINLLVRSTNLPVNEFYARLGYQRDDVVCLGKRLEHDAQSSVADSCSP